MTANNFALTTLSQHPEYFEEVIRLIEEGFRYSEKNHYEIDFAPLVNPLNFENCFLYIDTESNSVAAHLAICCRTLIKDEIETPIALIGGIVTDKKYRKQNLFKSLMDFALTKYSENVSMFILWSDLEGIYEKFSFHRSGGIIETGKKDLSSSERPSGYEKTKFSLLSDNDFENINHLYHSFNEKNFFTIKREDKDWSIIKEMGSIDLYVKRNEIGEIKKYFCINKGKDLTNIIHEISCLDQSEYLAILKELSPYKVWLPESEQESVSSQEIFYTAFMKLGNKNLLNDFLGKVSHQALSIQEINADLVIFEFQQKSYRASHKDFLQYLFGPKPLDEFTNFKLSLYIAGADSI